MEWHSSGHSSLKTQSSGRNKKESYHDEDTSGKNWPEICHDLCARGGSYLEDGGLLDMSVETRESGREERIRSHVKFLISSELVKCEVLLMQCNLAWHDVTQVMFRAAPVNVADDLISMLTLEYCFHKLYLAILHDVSHGLYVCGRRGGLVCVCAGGDSGGIGE